MTERIEVGYAPTPLGNGVKIYHKYILYTDSTGRETLNKPSRFSLVSTN